jgi:hypothetical protein
MLHTLIFLLAVGYFSDLIGWPKGLVDGSVGSRICTNGLLIYLFDFKQ